MGQTLSTPPKTSCVVQCRHESELTRVLRAAPARRLKFIATKRQHRRALTAGGELHRARVLLVGSKADKCCKDKLEALQGNWAKKIKTFQSTFKDNLDIEPEMMFLDCRNANQSAQQVPAKLVAMRQELQTHAFRVPRIVIEMEKLLSNPEYVTSPVSIFVSYMCLKTTCVILYVWVPLRAGNV